MNAENQTAGKRIIDAQAAKGVSPKWGVVEHCAMLQNRLFDILTANGCKLPQDDAKLAALKKVIRGELAIDGLGCNASQFRQNLFKALKIETAAAAQELDY